MIARVETNYEVEVFYDGICPICVKEMRFIQRKDRSGAILFTDIAAPDFDPSDAGIPREALMDRIHGRLADGTVIEGVEVFRRLYDAIGYQPLVRLSRLPGIRRVLDWGYRLFARNRMRLTGRCDAESCSVTAPTNTEWQR